MSIADIMFNCVQIEEEARLAGIQAVMAYNPELLPKDAALILPQFNYWQECETRSLLDFFLMQHLSHETLHAVLDRLGLDYASLQLDKLYLHDNKPSFYSNSGIIVPYRFLELIGENDTFKKEFDV